MLIVCKECKNKVSDTATSCPSCGAPIKNSTIDNNEANHL